MSRPGPMCGSNRLPTPKLRASGRRGGGASSTACSASRAHAGVPAMAAAACLALVLASCTGNPDGPPTGSSPSLSSTAAPAPHPGKPQRLDLQLEIPWAAVFLPDGTAVISERDTALLKAVRGGEARELGKVPGVVPGGEGACWGLQYPPLSQPTATFMPTSRPDRTTGLPVFACRQPVTALSPWGNRK
jgi:hypothetical protein